MKETKKVKVNWHGQTKELNLGIVKWPNKKYKYLMDVDINLYIDGVGDPGTYEDIAMASIASGLLILCTGAEYFEYTKCGPAGGNERFVIYDNEITNLLPIQQYLLDVCGFGAESVEDTPAQIYYIEK